MHMSLIAPVDMKQNNYFHQGMKLSKKNHHLRYHTVDKQSGLPHRLTSPP
ncbi:MAG: hypothetical protein LKKZDAJK_002439 [Candidatus Fervidibacter sp.]